jgi:hypothetical protein
MKMKIRQLYKKRESKSKSELLLKKVDKRPRYKEKMMILSNRLRLHLRKLLLKKYKRNKRNNLDFQQIISKNQYKTIDFIKYMLY